MSCRILDFQERAYSISRFKKWLLARNKRRYKDSLQVIFNPLANLIDHLALAQHFPGDAMLNGADPVIRSPHHLAEASAMTQLLIGIAGAVPSGMREQVSRLTSQLI